MCEIEYKAKFSANESYFNLKIILKLQGKAQFLLMTLALHCPNCYIKIDSCTEPCRGNLVNPVSSVKPGEAGVDDIRTKSGPKYKSFWRENPVCDGYSG